MTRDAPVRVIAMNHACKCRIHHRDDNPSSGHSVHLVDVLVEEGIGVQGPVGPVEMRLTLVRFVTFAFVALKHLCHLAPEDKQWE